LAVDVLSATFGEVEPKLRQRIGALQSVEKGNRLLVQVVKIDSIEQLTFE